MYGGGGGVWGLNLHNFGLKIVAGLRVAIFIFFSLTICSWGFSILQILGRKNVAGLRVRPHPDSDPTPSPYIDCARIPAYCCNLPSPPRGTEQLELRLTEQLSCQGSEPRCTSSRGPKSPSWTDLLTPPCDVSCIRLLLIAMSNNLNQHAAQHAMTAKAV